MPPRLEAELAKALIPSSEQRAGGQEVVTAKEASGRFPWLDWVELVRLAVRAGPAEPLLLPGRLPVYLARLDAVLGHRLHSAAGRAELSHFLNWRAVASLLPHLPRPFRQSRADLAARLAGIQPRSASRLSKLLSHNQLIPSHLQAYHKLIMESLHQRDREKIQVCSWISLC